MDCVNRSEVDGTRGWYQITLWRKLVRSNIEHECVYVFKHEELKRDLSPEESVFITTSDGNHTSRLCWYGQKWHRMYLWLTIWLCDWEMTLTSILELLYWMYVMRTGKNSRAGAICYPNERWWWWSLVAEGLDTTLTANKNITHSPIAVGVKSFDDFKHKGLCCPLKRMIEALTTRLTFLMFLN